MKRDGRNGCIQGDQIKVCAWADRLPRRASSREWPPGPNGRPKGTAAEELKLNCVGRLAEVKARINAIARTGIPEVNAMTEGFLDRE